MYVHACVRPCVRACMHVLVSVLRDAEPALLQRTRSLLNENSIENSPRNALPLLR